jgi:uncharacterized surface protein with fasciclin (FAS1) repeats
MKIIGKLLALLVAFSSTAYAGPMKSDMKHSGAQLNIVETAMGNSDFSTLVALVKEAGLVDTLSSEGPFTLFAPTNAAFAKIPAADLIALKNDKAKLASVLTYHVVSGNVPASKVVGLSKATTVQGSSVAISSTDGVKVGDANVTKTDIMTSNGVIHIIDTVLIPAG